jgi:surfeit locus 1 family protein
MRATERRRLAALAVAAGVAILAGLGTWQVERLHWKEALIAERHARLAAPPIADWGEAAPFRRVRLEGVYLADRALAVGMQGRTVTPMLLDDGSVALVESGAPLGGRAMLEGVLRESESPGRFTPANDPAKGQWFTADVAAMARALRLDRVRPFLVATRPPPDPANDHLQYAITWYSLAVALVVIYVLSHRRRRTP